MSDIIDINVGETIEEVTINVTDNLITVNINKVTGGGGEQTLAQTLDLGNTTGGENISISNGDAIILDNGSMLKKGTIDAGNGGSKGISQICGVGFEHKWEAGRLYIMNDGGTIIREVSHNLTYTPTATDDVTKGFVQNTRWILDNGDVYLCTDPTEDAAVWELVNTGTTPTLQEVATVGNILTDTEIVFDSAFGNKEILMNVDDGIYVKDIDSDKLAFIEQSALGISNYDGTNTTYLLEEGFNHTSSGGFQKLTFDTIASDEEIIIPNASGTLALTTDITTPTLQQVTDAGNETTQTIKVKDNEKSVTLQTNGINYEDIDDGGTTNLRFINTSVANQEIEIRGLSGTLALLSDIPTLVAGTNISIDDTDPLNPIISSSGGGVTSVGLTMPSAFSVTNSPITSSGDIAVTGAGLVSQYVRGDGTLANFPNSTGGGSSVNYYLNGSVSQGTFGGDTYYEMSKTPILGAGTNFTRTNGAGNGYIASFITDAGDPSFLNIPGGNWNLEFYFQSSATGGSPQFYGEIYKVSATNVFTLVASGSANAEGITNGTTVDQYFTSIPVPQTSLLITDRLAVRIYVITSGRTITLHTENGNLCEVLTTFTTGLTALNGLTQQVQNLAVGTSGTDFAISSATDTHTFNLPTASASNRGALSSTDWSTFNGKQNALSYTPYKFIQTGITAHTGTVAETIIATATIAGGTFNTSDVMKVMFGANKATAISSTLRIKINTSNTLTGAVTLAGMLTTSANALILKRNFMLNGGNLYGMQFAATNTITDEATVLTNVYNSTAYNTANTLYLFFTIQITNIADSVTPNLFNITN